MTMDLLSRARSGDRDAIAEVVLEHQAVIRSYIARLAPDPVTADDLAQDVFVAALKSLDRIDPQLGLRPYLLGVARNMARTAWRVKLRGREVLGEQLMATLSARAPAENPDRRLDALDDCLKRIAPKARGVVLRHYRDEERCDEIAASLGTTSSNVRSILTRVRQTLHDCIRLKLQGAAP